ncbi:Isopentenyl-diphosphate Delta-isomerase [Gracilaria domingensis]|nr:Isopentenyl-diphosphate Delta-isomerase [Gracilaria domingensis]
MQRTALPLARWLFSKKMVRRGAIGRSNVRLASATSFANDVNQKQDVLAEADPEQARLMAEQVILVDHEDNVLGSMSKKDSHLVGNNLPLHRAFSVLLFDTKGRMLLQQRANEKVTFPAYWTNTVCSHPLYRPIELGEEDGGDSVMGAKHAAIRKLSHELGVKSGAVQAHDLLFMTRILYRSECEGSIWGEHELDYIFFVQKDIEIQPEPNEVQKVLYVTKEELYDMFNEGEKSNALKITPWFALVMKNFGWSWWDIVMEKGFPELESLQDNRIRKYSE